MVAQCIEPYPGIDLVNDGSSRPQCFHTSPPMDFPLTGFAPLGEGPVTGTRGRWRRGTEGDGDLTGNLYLFKNNVGTIRTNHHIGTLTCRKCRGEKSSTSLVYHFFHQRG